MNSHTQTYIYTNFLWCYFILSILKSSNPLVKLHKHSHSHTYTLSNSHVMHRSHNIKTPLKIRMNFTHGSLCTAIANSVLYIRQVKKARLNCIWWIFNQKTKVSFSCTMQRCTVFIVCAKHTLLCQVKLLLFQMNVCKSKAVVLRVCFESHWQQLNVIKHNGRNFYSLQKYPIQMNSWLM